MDNQDKERKPFGLWPSPISPASMAGGISVSDPAWDQGGSLVWKEGRSDRAVLVVRPPDGQAPRDLNSDYAVRGRVGYGGGDFTVSQGMVVFAEAASGRLYVQALDGGQASPLTPGFGSAAAPAISPDGRWVLYVHTYEDQDSLGIASMDGQGWPIRIAHGRDFYMQPAWHPDGGQIAYIAWDHPNMPWDGTELVLGQLDRAGVPNLTGSKTIAGGPEVSIFQPAFSPDGRYLAYVSDESGWWQINTYDLESGEHHQWTNTQAEHGLPAWAQGMRTYAFGPDGQTIFYIRNQQGIQTLRVLGLVTGEDMPLNLEGYASLDQPAVSPNGASLAVTASGPGQPSQLLVCRMDETLRVVRRATAENLPPDFYAQPQPISWPDSEGEAVYGLFYPPHSPNYKAQGEPPLIVSIHGGPTGQRGMGFSQDTQFYTSRGYACLVVNYRGSSGYGRVYRDKLKGNWGLYDVEDAVSGARHLADRGMVDPERMVIIGGSAGGYTVLKALVDYPGFFKAGICLYGISNLFTLAADTHKFEAHYTDSMIGPLPEAGDIYRQRSPLFFIDRIQDPVAIFQGEDDVVVPRAQSDEMASALQRRGVPYEYHLYPGEGHGFRKTETIQKFYEAVDRFLRTYVIFT
jgi:dipeptidyl aminopeptidase/acylaminoacyl peptidase